MEDAEEANDVEKAQENVEITIDSGAAKSVWPIRKKESRGRTRRSR